VTIAACIPAPENALRVEDVLDAWRLVNPLRYAVQLLLDYGGVGTPASRMAVLAACRTLLSATKVTAHPTRAKRSSDLLALPVADAFGVEALGIVLIELRWAGLAASVLERDMHLDVAEQRLGKIMADLREATQ